jgi:hypothetical protein
MFGMDYLGGAMFPSILLRAHPAGWAAGFFADTFGNCWGVADKLAASRKCPLIRINGPWTAHKYVPAQHDKAIFAAFEKTKALAGKYPGVRFQFSPVCESDGRGVAWRGLFAKLKQTAGPVEIVCSIYKGEVIQGFLVEVHGSHKPHNGAYQYSYDGTSAVDANVQKDKEAHRKAGVFFLWVPSFNLKYKTKLSGDETLQVRNNDGAPPKERHCKPTVELIESLVALASDKGGAALKPRNLWKSHADRGSTPPDGRAWKPVLISPARASFATLVDSNNNVVAKSGPPSKYHDGRWTYRFPKYGYQIAVGLLGLRVGSQEIGVVNPAFREGEYRS